MRVAAFTLPLLVISGVWWLAGLPSPKGESGAADGALPERTRSVAGSVSNGARLVMPGSFGLPEFEVAADDAFARFHAWASTYAESPAGANVAEGVQLARVRREALKSMIQTDPKAALARALPWSLRNRMPAAVAGMLEERVSSLADYSVMAGRPLPGVSLDKPILKRSAVIGDRVFKAYVYGRREWLTTKNGLPVEGIAVDNQLAISERPVRELEPGEPQPQGGTRPAAQDEHIGAPPPEEMPVLVSGGRSYQTCCTPHASALEATMNEAEETPGPALGTEVAGSVWTEGPKKLLVIRVDFSDLTGVPRNINPVVTLTPDFATTLVNGVTNTFMLDNSFGKSSVSLNSADVTPVLRMPRTASYYAVNDDADRLRLDCQAAATAAGYVPSTYDRQLVVFSFLGDSVIPGSEFLWAGLGQVGGPFTWYNGYFDARVVPHELGHNLGLWHANLWRVSGTNPVSTTGVSRAYEDPFDGMGNGFYAPVNLLHFNPWFLNRIDWLPNAAVQTVTGPGDHRIYRYDHRDAPQNRKMALKITKDAQRNYWIGYRRKFAGVSGGLADGSAGAYIVWGFNTNQHSQLIDVDTPTSNPNDASLNVGSMLRDPDAGLIIRVVGSGGSGVNEYLDIRIDQDNRVYPLQAAYDVDESAGSVQIQLARSGEPNETTVIEVSTEDGSATAPSDYTAKTQTITWEGTDREVKTFDVPITANSIEEMAETFRVNIRLISSPTVQVAGSPVLVTIREPGMLDANFVHPNFAASRSILDFATDPAGKTVIVGSAATAGSSVINGIARLAENGSLDAAFLRPEGAAPAEVLSVARQPDGRYLVGGSFVFMRGQGTAGIARLEDDGGLDTSFDPGSGANGAVKALAVQADGRILVGGAFTSFDGQPRPGVARLNRDGSLDATFQPQAIENLSMVEVCSMVIQANGQILVGGDFRLTIPGEGEQGSGVMRLNTDGSLDDTFDVGLGAGAGSKVLALAVQSDDKILAGGDFTTFDQRQTAGFVRLNVNGSVDEPFRTALADLSYTGAVRSLCTQSDGRILMTGDMTRLGGIFRNYLVRFMPDGSLDNGFDADLPLNHAGGKAIGYKVAMLPDGRIQLATDSYASTTSTLRRIFSGQPGRSGVAEFVSGSAMVNEGGFVELQVRRTGGSQGRVSVNYSTIAGTAGEPDFVSKTETLVWNHGDTSVRTISIDTLPDTEAEETEYFSVQLGVTHGGISLGERAIASVGILDPGAAGFVRVNFQQDASAMTEGGAAQVIHVELSAAAEENITVPLQISGTATNAGAGTVGDYRLQPSTFPLVFLPGEVSKTITVTTLQDSIEEGTELINFRLLSPTGPVLLGQPVLHTLSLLDDDRKATVVGAPQSIIVPLGALAGPFEVQAAGALPMTMEWYVNKRKIAGANTESLSIHQATLKDAGAYAFKVKNKGGESYSPDAELVVVDRTTRTIVLPVGGTASFKASAAGNGIWYTWRKVDASLNSHPRAVRKDNALTIPKLELGDSGTYICRVSSSVAKDFSAETPVGYMDAGTFILKVVDQAPEITGLSDGDFLPEAIVGGSYDFAVSTLDVTRQAAMTFSASGLPPGLKIDSASGVIFGKPTAFKAVPYEVTLTAANKSGKDVVKVKLKVLPMTEGLAGDYVALVQRNTSLNAEIGGRLDLKVTATGAFSGKLVHGGVTHALKGVLDVSHPDTAETVPPPSARLRIIRTGKPAPRPLDLYFEIDTEAALLTAGTLTDGIDSVSFTGWRQTWDAKNNKADAFAGYHTFAVDMPDAIPNVPKGYGFGSLTVSPAGVAAWAGKSADGEKLTGSAFISKTGDVAIYQPLYKTKPGGAMLGVLQLQLGDLPADASDNRLDGMLSWNRPPTSTKNARVYKGGFGIVEVAVFGGRYLPKPLALDVAAASDIALTFGEAGPAPSRNPDAEFDVALKNKLTLVGSSATGTTLKADAAKGGFSGKFVLEDVSPRPPPPVVKRPVSFEGMVVPTDGGLRGYGFYLLPQLPSNEAEPPTTPTTSPVLSGTVHLEPAEAD